MPFIKVDPVKESARLQQEEIVLRNDLMKMRKLNKITQKGLQQTSGLSQQAISRIEVGKDVSPSLKSLIKYVDAIGCRLKLELKEDATDYSLNGDK